MKTYVTFVADKFNQKERLPNFINDDNSAKISLNGSSLNLVWLMISRQILIHCRKTGVGLSMYLLDKSLGISVLVLIKLKLLKASKMAGCAF
jgi:hypothetical protein